jgi:hypothetical protein
MPLKRCNHAAFLDGFVNLMRIQNNGFGFNDRHPICLFIMQLRYWFLLDF